MKLASLTFAMIATMAATTAVASDDFVLPTTMDDIETFRNVDGWTVFQDKTRGSCFFSKSNDEGALVQMGLTQDQALGYIGLFSKDAEVEEGMIKVAVILNGNLYTGESKRVASTASGHQGGYIVGLTEQLRKDLRNSDELVAFPEAPFKYTINLDGVKNAIFETIECMEDLAS